MATLMTNCVRVERFKINVLHLLHINAYISNWLENMLKPEKHAVLIFKFIKY